MKKALITIFTIIILLAALAFGGFTYVKSQLMPVVEGEATEEVKVEIPYGMSVSQVSDLLAEKKLIKNSKIFYYSVRFPFILDLVFGEENDGNKFALKSGTYTVKNNLNAVEIQKLLSSGQQEFIKVSFPEGLTITKIGTILEDNNICSKDDFINASKNSELIKKYNILGKSLEGFLFPDTYFFTKGMDAIDVAEIMVKNFFEKIKLVDNLEGKSPSELWEIVKLASIVEREYRVADEAPLIASVFKNRLRHNIGLYSCATIVYIMTEIEGREHPKRVLISDTRIDSPYNTYLYAGLPPGPISNPGLVALDATVNTPKTDYYFFQIADQDEGRHVFSTTFEEHKINHTLSVK